MVDSVRADSLPRNVHRLLFLLRAEPENSWVKQVAVVRDDAETDSRLAVVEVADLRRRGLRIQVKLD